MSVLVPDHAISSIGRVSSDAFTLYCYMLSIIDCNCQTTVDYETMRQALNVSKSTIRDALIQLKAAGLVTWKRRFDKSSQYTVYTSTTVVPVDVLTPPVNRVNSIKDDDVNTSTSTHVVLVGNTPIFSSDFDEAFYVYNAVTSFMAFNSQTQKQDIARIGALVKTHGILKAVEYAKPYFEAWCNRISKKTGKTYSKMNTAWLDWAIAGEIPSNGNGHKPEQQHPANIGPGMTTEEAFPGRHSEEDSFWESVA